MIRVTAGYYPGRVKDYVVPEDTTVAQILEQADLTVGAKKEVRKNTEPTLMSDVLEDGDIVLVSEKSKGN